MALRRLILKAANRRITWLRTERWDGKAAEAERPGGLGEVVRSQSLHNTEAVSGGGKDGQQNRPEGREAGSWMREVWMEQENPDSAVTAKQGRDATGGESHGLWWTEATIWTDRMVSALGNGVRGGEWSDLNRASAAFADQGLFTLQAAFEDARYPR